MLNKLLGSRMMQNAENLNLLAPEQYGSRHRKSAAEHAVNKRLVFDIARQSKSPLALCSKNAKSCYDGIAWPVASLALQRVGIPHPLIITMLQTLQLMRHRIQTIFEDSTSYYDISLYSDIHGGGQGNGAAPGIWALISFPLLNLYQEAAFATEFIAPLTKEGIQLASFAFKDATDLCITSPHSSEDPLLISHLQTALDQWEGTRRAMGGALEPHWVLCDFKWTAGQWSYCTPADRPGTLVTRNAQGTHIPLERIDPSDGRRTLGVRLAANGNNDSERDYLRHQAKAWAERVQAGKLPRNLVGRRLTTMFWPKLQYPRPATAFTKEECRSIMAPALKAGLSASGVVGTLPRSLVHSPPSSYGPGLYHLFTSQGWNHVSMAIRHGSDPKSITGKLLCCFIQHTTVEIGLPWEHDQFLSKWWYSAADNWLYRVFPTVEWSFHSALCKKGVRLQRQRFFQHNQAIATDAVPGDLQVAKIQICPTHIRLTRHAPRLPSSVPEINSFPQSLTTASPTEAWAFHNIVQSDLDGLAVAMHNGTCIALSDGSYKYNYGTAGWTLKDPGSTAFLKGRAITTGPQEDQSSVRSELAGIYAIICVASRLLQWFHFPNGAIEIGCDSTTSLNQTFRPGPLAPTTPHHDLLSAIHRHRDLSSIAWTPRHVCGHQNMGSSLPTDGWTQLNINMDRWAKHLWTTHVHTTPANKQIEGEAWVVWPSGEKFTSLHRESFREHIHSPTG